MKIKTKLLSLVLAMLLVCAALAGCGGSSSSESSSSSSEESEAYDYSAGLTENGFWEGVDAASIVTLPKYVGIEIPADVHTVTDEAIQEQIDSVMANYGKAEQLTDRAVEDGDTVNIDYVGSIDGVEFSGGNTGGSGTDVTIGVTSYIDDFLEQLIGHMPGETFNVEVTFPESYPQNTDLQGKDAVFVTTINYIEGEMITPEFTDEFVAENLTTSYGWETVEDVRSYISESLQYNAEVSYLETYLTENSSVGEIPQSVTDYQESSMKNYYKQAAAYYQMDLDTLLSYYNVSSLDEMVASSADSIKESSTLSLIMQAIAEDAGLTVTDEDLAAYFLENTGSEDYSSYTAQYGLPYLRMLALSHVVYSHLRDNAVRA